MNLINTLVFGASLALLNLSAFAAGDERLWEPAHGGGLTVSEIIAIDTENALAIDPESTVQVSISIPLVMEGVQLVDDVSGLPGLENGLEVNEVTAPGFSDHGMPADGNIESAVITLPFDTGSYITDGSLNYGAMEFDLQQLVHKLVDSSNVSIGKNKNWQSTQNGSNQSNCGGYSLGSTFSVSQNMGCLGTIKNTYQCQPNATGGRDWFVTSTERFPAEHDIICQ